MVLTMLSFFKRRAFLVALGLALVAVFIWLIGPMIKFEVGTEDWRPLESVFWRFVAIVMVIAAWGVRVVLKRRQAGRASDQLVAAVVKQSQTEARPSAEAVQLRERFEEAVGALKQKRRGGHSLYDLPWYVIIGAPGSGKTTALVNSGLHFPLEQRSGKGALRGVGGTRNCDWWFTDEAVFLDTAGRYTTQDSDASADSAAWAEFLALLKKYRKRRPVNGVILAISAHDLMVQGQAGREAHVAAARRRLNELNKELRIQLPVYVLVTKCDLVAGFTEYFDDVVQEGRTQVWGVTFPYEMTQGGGAAKAFPAEFDGLIGRLNERVFARVEEDRDVRRRAKVFAFPQQMAAMKETLAEFLTDLFEATRFDQQIQLRGVYFTSGTQEGTPIDRLLGALGRRFAVPPEVVMPTGRGKAYFIERLLKDVLLAESGLAGVNRRVELQKAAAQLGAYVGMALIAVLGVLTLSCAYGQNRRYLDDLKVEVDKLGQTPAPGAGATLDAVLARLDTSGDVVASAARLSGEVSWWARPWGLYQGASIGRAADDAYARELVGALLGTMAGRIKQRLGSATEPVELYRYLKVYLMLKYPEHLDKALFEDVANQEWKTAYAGDPRAAGRLSEHFTRLLAHRGGLPSYPIDLNEVERARRAIPPESVPNLVYSLVKLKYRTGEGAAPRLDGLVSDQVFRTRQGTKLVDAVAVLFTKDVFDKIASGGADAIEKQFSDDRWVWGDNQPRMPSPLVREKVLDLYEDDYIRTWDSTLSSVGLVPLASVDEMMRALRTLAGKDSALRELLKTVDTHTFLVSSMDTAKSGGVFASLKDGLVRVVAASKDWLNGNRRLPGARVTAHFAPIHALLAGEPGKAPIDAVLAQMQDLEKKLEAIGGALGQTRDAAAVAALGGSSAALKRDASELPGAASAVGALVTEISSKAMEVSKGAIGGALESQYRQDVVMPCVQAISGRYPFTPGATDEVLVADFTRMFGPGRTFETFFKTHLQDFVEVSRRPWTWKADQSGQSIALLSSAALRQFEIALRIREAFFSPSGELRATFSLTFVTLDTPTNRVFVELDGQVFDHRHGPERAWPASWPGPKPGAAAVTFEERTGGRPSEVFKGPWSLFRLVDFGKPTRETDERYVLSFQKNGHKTDVRVEADSVLNPFAGRSLLRGFSCGG